jgi:hypothetical protein
MTGPGLLMEENFGSVLSLEGLFSLVEEKRDLTIELLRSPPI